MVGKAKTKPGTRLRCPILFWILEKDFLYNELFFSENMFSFFEPGGRIAIRLFLRRTLERFDYILSFTESKKSYYNYNNIVTKAQRALI